LALLITVVLTANDKIISKESALLRLRKWPKRELPVHNLLEVSDGALADDASAAATVVDATAVAILQPDAERLTDVYLGSDPGQSATAATEHPCHPHKFREFVTCQPGEPESSG
jgi:hypothetical protein